MRVYRELLFRNVEGFIANGFPVLHRIMSENAWQEMVRDFFARHRARTPLFPQLTREFLYYLEHERGERPGDYPFMRELAHYEWMETQVLLDGREIPDDGYDPEGDLLTGIPVLSPLASLLDYRWPVHRISPAYLPDMPPDISSYLLIFRRRDHTHGFMELNTVSAALFERLRMQTATGMEILHGIAEELGHPRADVVVRGGSETLQAFFEREIVLGARSDVSSA